MEAARLQQLRRRLYAMRNGIVADALKKGGCPYPLIYGVNLPQLNEIAREIGISEDDAEILWADKGLRESALLAPMIFPVEKLTIAKARQLIESAAWEEEIDILCLKLIRNADFAAELAEELSNSNIPFKRYAGLRLWLNLINKYPHEALLAAKRELEQESPLPLARLIIDNFEE